MRWVSWAKTAGHLYHFICTSLSDDTICYYCACNKIVTNNRAHARAYLGRLINEMRVHRGYLTDRHSVEQLHFGGGTPTYLSNEQFVQVFEALHENFNLETHPERDFSIEIDPRMVDESRIHFLAQLGLNRLSLGIQDFDRAVQKAVNRLQSGEDTNSIMNAARNAGFTSVSVDLIYGLPLQTPASFKTTLSRVLRLDPDRLSIYSYAHLPQRFKTQRQIKEADLPDAETKLSLIETAIDTLDSVGYVYIGMDHFAKASDSLVKAQFDGTLNRNFQGYTTHGQCDLIGLGVSAISSVNGVYCQNTKDLTGYNQSIDAGHIPIEKGLVLTQNDLMLRDLIHRLMCHFHLDLEALKTKYGSTFEACFNDQRANLETFVQEGLVILQPNKLTVTDKGRYLIRNICMVFDQYLPQSPQDLADQQNYSRAI